MGCSKCAQYSFSLGRCVLGRIMPKTIKGGIKATRIMGNAYVCGKSPLKAKIMTAMRQKMLEEI